MLQPRLAAVALCAATALACSGSRDEQASQTSAPQGPAPAAGAAGGPVTLGPENVATVAQQELRSGPLVQGTLVAERAASIRAEVGGTVLEVLADQGERVKAGQSLARMDAAVLQDQVRAAQSGVASARNALRVAESEAERAKMLAQAGALAAREQERAEAGLEAARAALADAQARLALAQQQLDKSRVRAPFAGVVSARQVSAGDVVAPGAPLFTVIDPRRLEFEASVPAALLGRAKVGARVDFTVTGFGDRSFEGTVDRVNAAVDPATGQVKLYVDVPNDQRELIAGLYAQGRIAAESATALAAPVAAVDDTTQPPSVLRIVDGKAHRSHVRLGLRDEQAGLVALRDGVAAGDVLVLGSARGGLAEGAAVRVAEGRTADAVPPAPAQRSN